MSEFTFKPKAGYFEVRIWGTRRLSHIQILPSDDDKSVWLPEDTSKAADMLCDAADFIRNFDMSKLEP